MIAVLALALGVGMAVVGTARADRPCVQISLSDLREDVTFVPCANVFVVREGAGPRVFVAETPHLPKEPLEYDQRFELFVSPFHGEIYDLEGRRVRGPGRPRLWECEIEVRGDEISILGATGAQGVEDVVSACKRSSD